MASRLKRDAGTAWLEKTNPLRGLSIREAQSIFDAARNGDTQRLHWIFQEIEGANPTLMTCVERRTSALAGLDYGVTVRPAADQALGDEQKDAVERFIADIENFDEMLEHLDLAFFRGFAYAQPLWEADGTVRLVSLLDSWQFLTKDGELYFNPVCDGFTKNAELVTREAGLIGLKRRRSIDYPALSIHIREAVGERDWGRFLERIALPKPAITMAPNSTEKDRAAYVQAAEETEDGKSSVWPNGTNITDFMGGSRGQDPFSGFIRHQEEKIVLLSTGGTLTSLAQADTGSLAGGAQMEVWREIVAKDAVAIEGAIKRALIIPFIEKKFPGQPIAVDFNFDRTKKLTAKESAEVAVSLKNAGYLVDQSELEQATGFTLEKAPEAQVPQNLSFARAKAAEKKPGNALATALQDAFEAAIGEAMSEELTGKSEEEAKAKRDANGMEHDLLGRFGEGGGGGSVEKKSLSEQLSKHGYSSREDLEKQALAVSKERVSQIASGDLKEHCKPHEAIAVLRSNPKIKNSLGQDVTFGDDMILHYVSGRGRENNQPDIERLKELPLAMHAVKHDKNPKLQYLRGAIHDPMNPPKGTQYVYQENVSGGTMQCRAWVDSGKVKGWFVK